MEALDRRSTSRKFGAYDGRGIEGIKIHVRQHPTQRSFIELVINVELEVTCGSGLHPWASSPPSTIRHEPVM